MIELKTTKLYSNKYLYECTIYDRKLFYNWHMLLHVLKAGVCGPFGRHAGISLRNISLAGCL